MKSKVDDSLYYVEKILRLEEIKGQLFAIVKWHGFSLRQTTKEPIEDFKDNPHFSKEIQKMEAEFRNRHQARSITHQRALEIQRFRKILYPELHQTTTKKQGPDDQVKKEEIIKGMFGKKEPPLVPLQKAFINVEASKAVSKKVVYGLGSLQAQDYFNLQQLREEAMDRVQMRHKNRQDILSELAVEEVKGLTKSGKSYQFILTIGSQIVVCSDVQMSALFPTHLLNYLTRFLKYMRQEFNDQIEKAEQQNRRKNYRLKSINTVQKMVNISHRIRTSEKEVHFGLDEEDLINNIQLHLEKQRNQSHSFQQDDISPKSNKTKEKNKSPQNTKKTSKKHKFKANQLALKMTADMKNLFNDIKTDVQRSLFGASLANQQLHTPERKRKRPQTYNNPDTNPLSSSLSEVESRRRRSSRTISKKKNTKKNTKKASKDNSRSKSKSHSKSQSKSKSKKKVEGGNEGLSPSLLKRDNQQKELKRAEYDEQNRSKSEGKNSNSRSAGPESQTQRMTRSRSAQRGDLAGPVSPISLDKSQLEEQSFKREPDPEAQDPGANKRFRGSP